jgi:predicted metalloendopeptidase
MRQSRLSNFANRDKITTRFRLPTHRKSSRISSRVLHENSRDRSGERDQLRPADFFAEVNKMLTDVPVDAWRTYFRWMLVSGVANALPKAFVDEAFNFNGRVLTGVKEQQPRWKRCVSATDGNLGEALGAEYVKTKFTKEAETKMDNLISNLFVR